eukprot:3422868-Rhodomonas_salina.1
MACTGSATCYSAQGLEECCKCATGTACQNTTIQKRRWKRTQIIDAGDRGQGLAFDEDVEENTVAL